MSSNIQSSGSGPPSPLSGLMNKLASDSVGSSREGERDVDACVCPALCALMVSAVAPDAVVAAVVGTAPWPQDAGCAPRRSMCSSAVTPPYTCTRGQCPWPRTSGMEAGDRIESWHFSQRRPSHSKSKKACFTFDACKRYTRAAAFRADDLARVVPRRQNEWSTWRRCGRALKAPPAIGHETPFVHFYLYILTE
jgi:hypothetical protein